MPAISPGAIAGSRLVRNTASNFIALGWMSALSILTVPIYVRLLGADEWGVVAACASLQILFHFIDAGFSQIIPRWVARDGSDYDALRQHVRLFRRLYLVLATAGWVLVQLIADMLARDWFQAPPDKVTDLSMAIRIVATQLFFQFLNNVAIGVWNGMDQQPLANLRTCLFGTVKHAAAIATLLAVKPSAAAYATAFASVALCEALVNSRTLATQLTGGTTKVSSTADARPFVREAGMLSLGIVVGLLTSQLDRIVLSRSVPLVDFGIYVVVANLALALLQLQAPLTRALFPRMVQEHTAVGAIPWRTLSRLAAGNLAVMAPPAILVAAMAEGLLEAWLRDPRFAAVGALPLRLLLIAAVINVMYGCIYQAIVASGRSHLVLRFNLGALAAGIVAALVAKPFAEGLALGGIIWIAATSTQLALGLAWLQTQRTPLAGHSLDRNRS